MKILAVDDDPIILELLSQFIDAVGEHELTTAISGQEALDLIQASESDAPFECFFLDIQMPEMDGIELTRNIRSLAPHVDTPVLMLTAMSDKRYIDAAFGAGATDYVTKPFDIPELSERLRLADLLVKMREPSASMMVGQQTAPAANMGLNDPVSIYDVENVIEYPAMENYVRQLARGSMFGCSTFAFAIRKIEEHHAQLSATEFSFMISDVAEVISDTLAGHQFLMAYAGSGTFICVTESGWRPDIESLMNAVNLSLSRVELFDNAGKPLFVRVSGGDVVRMIWKSESSVLDTICTAYLTAEAASAAHEKSMNDLWSMARQA